MAYSHNFALSISMQTAVFDFATREFIPEHETAFCKSCVLFQNNKCNYLTAHRYGCFEAERWNGLYIYYCPLSLAFCSSVIYNGKESAYAIISGPVVMGQPEDTLNDNGGLMAEEINLLPRRQAKEMTALSRVQKALCLYLSGQCAETSEVLNKAQSNILNSLYDVTADIRDNNKTRYPLEIEQRLQKMIIRGDKQGAQELINQLLGALYFNSGGDFTLIKDRSKELVVLFSRASMEGGADIQQIFGQSRDTLKEIEHCKSMDELSVLLTRIFYRFVAYVFDFNRFEHTDILHKTINYVRENYASKITLEDVADHVGLSRSYLSTIIKEELGMPFTDYVNTMRIEKSKELLLNPDLSLAEIADLVGYSDQSYYTKVFTKAVGVSPGYFRKKRGKV